MFAPVLAWNAAHDWVEFRPPGRPGGATGSRRGRLQFLGELIGGQIGLATPLLAVLFGAGFVRRCAGRWRARPGLDPAGGAAGGARRWCSCSTPSATGCRRTGRGLYPQAAIAAAGLGGRWLRLRAPAAGLGLLLTAAGLGAGGLGAAAAARPPGPHAAAARRVGRLAAGVAAAARRRAPRYVAADNYGVAAELAWWLPPDLPVLALDERWRWFDLPDASSIVDGQWGLLVESERGPVPRGPDLSAPAAPTLLDRTRDGILAEQLCQYRVMGRAGSEPVVVLPRPEQQ